MVSLPEDLLQYYRYKSVRNIPRGHDGVRGPGKYKESAVNY